jgi:beta-carotene 15,15'-dioxygenase
MNQIIKVQGIAFITLCLCLLPVLPNLIALSLHQQVVIAAILVLTVGVPHGALDTILAEKTFPLIGVGDWVIFLLLYILSALTVVIVATFLPLVFIAGFLAMSVVHFTHDLDEAAPLLTKLLYGGAIIFIPAVLYGTQIRELFLVISGPYAGIKVYQVISFLAVPWLIALSITTVNQLKYRPLLALELLAALLIMLVAPPLISFTVYFCFMHSIRHVIKSYQSLKISLQMRHFAMIGVPMITVLVAIIFTSLFLQDIPFDQRVLRIIFIGLAALTVPHMVVVLKFKSALLARGNYNGE